MGTTLLNTFFFNKLRFIGIFRLIFDQGVCFRVRKFLWLSIFRVVF